MFLLVYLKQIFQGSNFDRYFRLFISYISPFYYTFSKKVIFADESKFLYVCYGGLGDCILAFPFLKNLSKRYKITILIEEKFKGIETLFHEDIEIIFYTKKQILKELKKYRKEIKKIIIIK